MPQARRVALKPLLPGLEGAAKVTWLQEGLRQEEMAMGGILSERREQSLTLTLQLRC